MLLLDGGRKKWELDSREMVTEVPSRPATTYRAQEQDRSIRAFRDDVVAAIGKLSTAGESGNSVTVAMNLNPRRGTVWM